MRHIDINCDMGEGIGNEALLMPFISSANIACGYHAGDAAEMKKMVSLCMQYDVAIGAHPSFPDRENFGRTPMKFTKEEIRDFIKDQLHTLGKISSAAGAKLHHVKLHGALYNMAAADSVLAKAIADTVKNFNSNLVYYGLSGSPMISEIVASGLRVAHEVFADRTYQTNGSLTPRSQTGALISDAEQAIRQVMQMVNEKKVTTVNGEKISIRADTICIHGDGEHAVEFAKMINEVLNAAGVQIRRIN